MDGFYLPNIFQSIYSVTTSILITTTTKFGDQAGQFSCTRHEKSNLKYFIHSSIQIYMSSPSVYS